MILKIHSLKNQSYGETCWAAAIASALNTEEAKILNLLRRGYAGSADAAQLAKVLTATKQQYHYLSSNFWESIKAVLDSGSLLVYYFPIETTEKSHFVNIYGYEENMMGKWLYIHDPKPDKEGSEYLLNIRQFEISLLDDLKPLKGVFYFGNPVSTPVRTVQQDGAFQKKMKKNAKMVTTLRAETSTLIESSSISDDFKSVVNLPDVVEKNTIKTYNEIREGLKIIERDIDKAREDVNFQIIRNNYFSTYFIPLVRAEPDGSFTFLTALTYSEKKAYFDTIFSIMYLNRLDVKTAILNTMHQADFSISIYIENDNYRSVRIGGGGKFLPPFQIDNPGLTVVNPADGATLVNMQNTWVSTPLDAGLNQRLKNIGKDFRRK